MKKILSIFLMAYIVLGSINFSYGQAVDQICLENCITGGTPASTCMNDCSSPTGPTVDQICLENCITGGTPVSTCMNDCSSPTPTTVSNTPSTTATTTTKVLPDDVPFNGITVGPKCLLNGQCKFNIIEALGIRQNVAGAGAENSPGLFVQDIILSATMFIGTVVTIAIIVSGLLWIFAGATGKDPTKAKTGLINSLIGLLMVVSSYLIIRLVQYIAKGF